MYEIRQEGELVIFYPKIMDSKEAPEIIFSLEPPETDQERIVQSALHELMERGAVDVGGKLASNIDELRHYLRLHLFNRPKAPLSDPST